MSGFIAIPRDFLKSDFYRSLDSAEKEILLLMLSKVVYSPTKFIDRGMMIELQPGQCYFTFRGLKEDLSKDIHHAKIQRTFSKFEKYQISIQKVIHTKTIFTLINRELYDCLLNASDTGIDTKVIQDRYIKEQDNKKNKEIHKEKYTKEKVAKATGRKRPPKISFSFEKRRFENLSEEDIAKWQKQFPTVKIQDFLLNYAKWIFDTQAVKLDWRSKLREGMRNEVQKQKLKNQFAVDKPELAKRVAKRCQYGQLEVLSKGVVYSHERFGLSGKYDDKDFTETLQKICQREKIDWQEITRDEETKIIEFKEYACL